jgi:hypothetical protein
MQQVLPDQTELLTKREVAARLKRSPRAISNYMSRRQIPFIRLNARSVLFNWPDVVEQLQQLSVR